MLHEMSWPIPRPEEVAAFDFVGGSGPEGPSIWAVLLECAAWSFAGFVARAQYFLTLLALGKVQSMPLIQVGSKLIGEAAAGISIAVALVALLWSSELTVLEIQMSLRNVGVGSVIAVSFVLGFFHDDSREILRRAGSRLFARD